MRTSGNHCEDQMALVRQSEGISVIFDKASLSSPASPHRHSRSRSSQRSHSRSSGRSVRRRGERRVARSSSSSSSSSSSGRSRSRSHPRCHRPAASCRRCCHTPHARHAHRHGSPPRRYRDHSRSPSSSSSPDSWERRSSSRSRSPVRRRRTDGSTHRSGSEATSYTRDANRNRSRSTSRSSRGSAVSLSSHGAEEKLQLTIAESHPEAEGRVRAEPVATGSATQNTDGEPEEEDGLSSADMVETRKIISFRINNAVAKPPVAGRPVDGKVTHREMSFSSTPPYGQWVPVRRPTHPSYKRTHTKSR